MSRVAVRGYDAKIRGLELYIKKGDRQRLCNLRKVAMAKRTAAATDLRNKDKSLSGSRACQKGARRSRETNSRITSQYRSWCTQKNKNGIK